MHSPTSSLVALLTVASLFASSAPPRPSLASHHLRSPSHSSIPTTHAHTPHRTADPILGLVSGLWAYYLYESRLVARGERPEDQTLVRLGQWKWDQREKAKAAAKAALVNQGAA